MSEFLLKLKEFINQKTALGNVKCPFVAISICMKVNIYTITSYLAFYLSILLRIQKKVDYLHLHN